MWTLRHSSGRVIHITPDTSITIGRKSGDLILNDKSVSHLHAKICVKRHHDDDSDDNNKFKLLSTCIISDEGSTRGTKILRRKEINLSPYTDYKLKPDDRINFGSNNVWTVSCNKISLLTCGDCVGYIQKLKKIITSIGGEVFTEWNESCNYYTTLCERVTPKFVTALAAGIPLVTLKYWEDFYNCYKSRKELPDPCEYSLKNWNYADELQNVVLHPIYARKNIFDGLEFVFFSLVQINFYAQMIELAGGRPLMCAKYGFKGKHLVSDNTVIIACDEHERTSNNCCGLSDSGYRDICRLLAKEKRKMIDEKEIVKAILLCSRDKYCNPRLHKRKISQRLQENVNNQENLVQDFEKNIVQAISHSSKVNKKNLKASTSEVLPIEHLQRSNENLIQSLENNAAPIASHAKVQKKENLDTVLENSAAPVSKSVRNLKISNENSNQNHEINVVHVVSPTNEQNEDVDIPLKDDTKNFKEKSSHEIQWIDVDKRIEEPKKSSSTSPTTKLPRAVVELEKLSDDMILTLKHNCNNEQQGSLIKKSGDRKRKNSSSNTSINLDSTPDLFESDDESSMGQRLNNSPLEEQIKIIDDKLITSKIILKTPNHKLKRRKVEQQTIASWLNVTNNEATNNVIENIDEDIQPDCNKNKSNDQQSSAVIIINDDNDNNKKIPNNQESKNLQPLVNQKAQSSDDKEKLDSTKCSVNTDNLLNIKNNKPSQRRKVEESKNETAVNDISGSQLEVVPSQNNKNLNKAPRKLRFKKELNYREDSDGESKSISKNTNKILNDKNVTISQDDFESKASKSNTTRKKFHSQKSPTEDYDTESNRPARRMQFSSLLGDDISFQPKVIKNNNTNNADERSISSKDRTTVINKQKQSSSQYGSTKNDKNKNIGENAVPSFLRQTKERSCKIISETSNKSSTQTSSNSCDNLDANVIEILDDFEKNMLNDNGLELLITQKNNQPKSVENKASLNKWQKGENAIPAFFMK